VVILYTQKRNNQKQKQMYEECPVKRRKKPAMIFTKNVQQIRLAENTLNP